MCAYGWRPYVPVAERRAQAAREMVKLKKKGVDVQPVKISGRKIAASFWGKAWCDHIESFHDYENRLPRGRTYVRNGSVCHLQIESGRIEAIVSGSELYNIVVEIAPLPAAKWAAIKKACSGKIDSLIDLLRGKLADGVMATVCDRQSGLFPQAGEIKFKCDCPDWAIMCKHVASVLYGVGARLDLSPDQLFLLRGVDHEELVDVGEAIEQAVTAGGSARRRLSDNDLGDVFGIDLSDEPAPAAGRRSSGDALPDKDKGKATGRAKKAARKSGDEADGKKAAGQKSGARVAKTATKTKVAGGATKARVAKAATKTRVTKAASKTKVAEGASKARVTKAATKTKVAKPATKTKVAKPASEGKAKRATVQVAKRKTKAGGQKKDAASQAPEVLPFPKPLTGNAVLRWRDSLEESQIQFGARFGVSGSCICQWELKGRKKINPQAEILEVLQSQWLRCGLRK